MGILRPICIYALALVLCFGPSATSQGIAYLGMLCTYVPEQGLIEGFSQTFDGEHPCALCQSIQAHDDQDADQASNEERRDHFRHHQAQDHVIDWQSFAARELSHYQALRTQYAPHPNIKPPILV